MSGPWRPNYEDIETRVNYFKQERYFGFIEEILSFFTTEHSHKQYNANILHEFITISNSIKTSIENEVRSGITCMKPEY